MITLGFNEFIRNFKRNILVIAQMIFIFIIAIFTVSAFEEQYSLYNGISAFIDDTGIVLESSAMNPTENVVNYDELMTLLDNIENIVITHKTNVYEKNFEFNNISSEFGLDILANNPKYNTYKPKLVDGVWCEDVSSTNGIINIVISNNTPFGFKVGDNIEIDGILFHITGIFDSNDMVYGYSTFSRNYSEMNYLDFYMSVTELSETRNYMQYLAIASYDDMMRELTPYIASKIVIDLDDNITEEEYLHNMSLLKEYYGYIENTDAYNANTIYANTMTHLEVKLLPMFILLAIVLFILTVSMITASSVNVLYEKKNYGIYFICGNDWKKTFVISTVHWLIVSVTSIIIATSGCLLMKASGKFENLTLTFTWVHILVIVLITVVTLFVSLIIPYNMLRKIPPVSILKENDD